MLLRGSISFAPVAEKCIHAGPHPRVAASRTWPRRRACTRDLLNPPFGAPTVLSCKAEVASLSLFDRKDASERVSAFGHFCPDWDRSQRGRDDGIPYEGAASNATPAMSAAAIVPRQIATKNGSVFRNLLRIVFPPPQPTLPPNR